MKSVFVYITVDEKLKNLINNELIEFARNNNIVDSLNFYNYVNLSTFILENPTLISYFNSFNITLKNVGFLVTSSDVALHYDEPRLSQDSIRINWPVLNCNGSKTKIFETEDKGTLVKAKNGVLGTQIDIKKAQFLTEFDLDCNPVAWYSYKYAHSVHVGNKVPRISITCWFHENLDLFFKYDK